MRRIRIVVILAAALLMFTTQFSMISVALQDIIDDLNAPLRWGGWALTAFLVAQVVSMSATGRLVERYGATNVFIAGVAGFGAASLACALSPSFTTFLLSRGIQGLAGGALIPSSQAILGSMYDENERTRVLGLFMSIMPFGAVAGPFAGGLIVEAVGWRWTFGLSVPIAAILLVGSFLQLPKFRPTRAARVDIVGAVLLLVAVTTLMLALTELGIEDEPANPVIIFGSLGATAVMVAILIWHQLRIPTPILDLPLLRKPAFLASNSLAFLFGMAWMGVFVVLPLYIQEAYDMEPTETGALMGPRALAMMVVSFAGALLLRTVGFRIPLYVGLIGIGVVLGGLSLGLEDPSILGIRIPSYWWLMIQITSAGFFFGFASPALNTAGIDLDPDKIATIAGMRSTLMMLGGTIGISLVVMSGSRAAETALGMERMFLGLCVALIGAILVVRWIPSAPGGGTSRPITIEELPATRQPTGRAR